MIIITIINNNNNNNNMQNWDFSPISSTALSTQYHAHCFASPIKQHPLPQVS
jgi:hypothetical protein